MFYNKVISWLLEIVSQEFAIGDEFWFRRHIGVPTWNSIPSATVHANCFDWSAQACSDFKESSWTSRFKELKSNRRYIWMDYKKWWNEGVERAGSLERTGIPVIRAEISSPACLDLLVCPLVGFSIFWNRACSWEHFYVHWDMSINRKSPCNWGYCVTIR